MSNDWDKVFFEATDLSAIAQRELDEEQKRNSASEKAILDESIEFTSRFLDEFKNNHKTDYRVLYRTCITRTWAGFKDQTLDGNALEKTLQYCRDILSKEFEGSSLIYEVTSSSEYSCAVCTSRKNSKDPEYTCTRCNLDSHGTCTWYYLNFSVMDKAEKARRIAIKQEEQERAQERAQTWASQGLCQYCGGKVSFFTGKCRSCKKPTSAC